MTVNGIDVALLKGFHKMTLKDMYRAGRAMLDSCPACRFEGLEAGKSYYYKPSYSEAVLVTVGQTTTKRQQVIASVNQGAPRRLYKGNYSGTFSELDADLLAMTGITHETIVAAAVAAGIEVPPEVRRQYPGLFVEIPKRFGNGRRTAAERVTQALTPPVLARAPVSIADIDQWIAGAHDSIASMRCERTRVVALNPDTAPDYDQYLDGYRDDIDFYRWLRRQVDVGEIFHVPTTASHAA